MYNLKLQYPYKYENPLAICMCACLEENLTLVGRGLKH